MNRLGQHFLKNKSAIKAIVDALSPAQDDTIVEIGAGHGELTGEVIKLLRYFDIEKFKIIAIEKDGNLVNLLKEKFSENKNIEIIEGDVLKLLLKLLNNLITNNSITKIKLVGNIPYYITGKLFRVVSELSRKPERCVFMVQKEVAERLASEPKKTNSAGTEISKGAKGMNRLAASVQFWAKPTIVVRVPREEFSPAPKVDSAVVLLESVSRNNANEAAYYRAVRALFRQPRKTILNNLRMSASHAESDIRTPGARRANVDENGKELIAKKLQKIGIDPNARPQNLSVDDIIAISSVI